MKFTKKNVKEAKDTIRKQMDEMFKLNDEKLLEFVQAFLPGMKLTDVDRNSLLRQGMIFIMEDAIPDSDLW